MNNETINPIIEVYKAVIKLVNTPIYCWKEVPSWMLNPIKYRMFDGNISECLYTELLELNGVMYCIFVANECTDDIVKSMTIKSPSFTEYRVIVISPKYCIKELTFKDHINVSYSIIGHIHVYNHTFDYDMMVNNYAKVIYYVALIKHFYVGPKLICDVVEMFIEDKDESNCLNNLIDNDIMDKSEILQLSEQFDNLIIDLLVNNGVYCIMK